jgi:hypothetical protein
MGRLDASRFRRRIVADHQGVDQFVWSEPGKHRSLLA